MTASNISASRRASRLTLGQFFAAGGFALAALVLVVLSLFYQSSRRTILAASEQIMNQASRRVTERVEDHLGEAERALEFVEGEARLGVMDVSRPDSIEPVLLGALVSNARVTEATFTYGRASGVYEQSDGPHDEGDLRLEPESRGQISAWRASDGAVVVRRVFRRDGQWQALERNVPGQRSPLSIAAAPADPTLHATFTVPSQPGRKGRAFWSDLSFIEADSSLAESERRRVVSVQKALWNGDQFEGVVRISLLSERVDELTQVSLGEGNEPGPEVIFLCDRNGRLISRLAPGDRVEPLDENGQPDEDGDLRVVPSAAPPQVLAALRRYAVREAGPEESSVRRLVVGDEWMLVSTAPLLAGRTQGWLVGMVVPESYFLGDLEAARRHVALLALLLLSMAAAAAAIGLRAMHRDLAGLLAGLSNLARFDFSAGGGAALFRDAAEASDSLEQAKTALRALGKYVPIDLVRQLYDSRMEPVLGGTLRDVTLLFSDIEGFTTISERLSPDELARLLGAYLEAMTRAIHSTSGVIDKYSGDGVMALWNAPAACERHAERACEAALACNEAAHELFGSPAWTGLEPWNTRFGIHRAEVSVGHYGAPERMSYTAMGDGVNLASRLEGLNKQYGTRILVSAAVERDVRSRFLLRRVDRVAVKGKSEGMEIFELVGRRTQRRPPHIERYEEALEAYFARRFDAALSILDGDVDDGPSRVLARRCRNYRDSPPPPDWDGVFVASQK